MKHIIISIIVGIGARLLIVCLLHDEYITNMFTLIGVAGWICDRVDSYLLRQETTS